VAPPPGAGPGTAAAWPRRSAAWPWARHRGRLASAFLPPRPIEVGQIAPVTGEVAASGAELSRVGLYEVLESGGLEVLGASSNRAADLWAAQFPHPGRTETGSRNGPAAASRREGLRLRGDPDWRLPGQAGRKGRKRNPDGPRTPRQLQVLGLTGPAVYLAPAVGL